jgi:catechol 2,3-dioxygenase-like lactoylglutathione lyase family enzyme
MIDHVSVGVRDLAASAAFYDAVLSAIGYVKLDDREKTKGWGKPGKHSEFWINARPGMEKIFAGSGTHVCLRAKDSALVDAFHQAALKAGGASDGGPGARPEFGDGYYAAFIFDLDGNKIEVVTFVKDPSP